MSESIFGGMMVPARSIVGGFEIICKRCHKKLTICTGNSVQAEEQARLHGWREMRDGWICWEHEDPNCVGDKPQLDKTQLETGG